MFEGFIPFLTKMQIIQYFKRLAFPHLGANWFMTLLATAITFTQCQGPSKNTEETSVQVVKDSIPASTSEIDTTKALKIIFFGNSLTAGMGLDVTDAFPALVGKKLDSTGIKAEIVNAGISGETTASGKNRVPWVVKNGVDVFVLELGANDGLRGIPTEETEKNLEEMIDYLKLKYPNVKILLTGMLVPPNMGKAYSEYFKGIFPKLAKNKNVALMPFLLEGVAGEPDLNQKDGIHPTKEGHQIIAQNLWKYLLPLVKK